MTRIYIFFSFICLFSLFYFHFFWGGGGYNENAVVFNCNEAKAEFFFISDVIVSEMASDISKDLYFKIL